MLEDDDPAWKKILLNELVLAFVAAVVILWLAFTFATGKKPDDGGKDSPQRSQRSQR